MQVPIFQKKKRKGQSNPVNLRACLVDVFKNCFLFSEQKTLKTSLVEGIKLFYMFSVFVIFYTIQRTRKNRMFSLFSP